MGTNTTDSVGKHEEEEVVVLKAAPVQAPAYLDTAQRYSPPADYGKVNTSRVVEEDLEYVDEEEPEVIHVVSAPRWYATFSDGSEHPLAFWAVLEDGKAYGVIVSNSETGGARVVLDASKNVSEEPGFTGYTYKEV